MKSNLIGLSTVRNEEDVVFEALSHLARFVDCGLIIDCGSDDRSVAEIQRAVAAFPHLVFLGEIGPHYSEQVRRHVWKHCRTIFDSHTWWMIADADEFVEDSVREKMAAATKEGADHIFSIHANFYYTQSEYAEWEAGKESLSDRQRPISSRRHFYRMNTWQIRLFRHLSWLRWNEDTSFPKRLSRPASDRVLFRHYQYRDPPQIQRRIEIRSSFASEANLIADNPHWRRTSFQEAISNGEQCEYWDGHSPLAISSEAATHAYPKPNRWKSMAKYGLAMMEGAVTRDNEAKLFHDFDFRGAIDRALRAKSARNQA